MFFEAVLTEVRAWTVQERLRLIEQVWDGFGEEDQSTELSDELKQWLDQRIEKPGKDRDAVVAWEVVEARAFERFRR